MTKPLAEQNYLEHSRVWFPEGVAPFGELNLIRVDHSRKFNAIQPGSDSSLAVMGPVLVHEAWCNSQWLTQAVNPNALARFKNTEGRNQINKAIANAVKAAKYYPQKQAAWSAVQPPAYELPDGDAIRWGLGPFIKTEQIVGFANAKYDVSGSMLQRSIKRTFNKDKVYAAVPNVAVATPHQKKGIGSALLFLSLGMFRRDQRPTTYAAETNKSLIDKLGELGYQKTGSRLRTDIVIGAEIEEVRLMADSVRKVRSLLISNYPWLLKANKDVAYRLDNN